MRASLSGGSLSVEPGSRRADPAFEQSECFESDGREFAKEATGELQLVLDPEFL
jgi:hypothetical protein